MSGKAQKEEAQIFLFVPFPVLIFALKGLNFACQYVIFDIMIYFIVRKEENV